MRYFIIFVRKTVHDFFILPFITDGTVPSEELVKKVAQDKYDELARLRKEDKKELPIKIYHFNENSKEDFKSFLSRHLMYVYVLKENEIKIINHGEFKKILENES